MTGKYDDIDDLPESIEQALACTEQDDGIILISEELPVLTLRNTVLFPGSIVPLGIGRPKTVRLVEEVFVRMGLPSLWLSVIQMSTTQSFRSLRSCVCREVGQACKGVKG